MLHLSVKRSLTVGSVLLFKNFNESTVMISFLLRISSMNFLNVSISSCDGVISFGTLTRYEYIKLKINVLFHSDETSKIQ